MSDETTTKTEAQKEIEGKTTEMYKNVETIQGEQPHDAQLSHYQSKHHHNQK